MSRSDRPSPGLLLLASLLTILRGGAAEGASSRPAALPSGAPEDWWAAARRHILAVDDELVPDGTGFRATNRAHGFEARFSADGIRLTPRSAEGGWELGLSVTGYGRRDVGIPLGAPATSPERNRFELRRPGFVEWYVNDERGIEQGFEIVAPVGARSAAEPLTIDSALTGTLRPRFAEDGRAIDFLGAGSLAVLRCNALLARDSTGAELPSRFEPIPGGIRIVVDDSAAVYPVTVDPLIESATPLDGTEVDAEFGFSVATAGDVNGDGYFDVVVGEPRHDAGAGAGADRGRVWVFPGSPSGIFILGGRVLLGDQNGALFGSSVATAGDVNGDGYADVVVGAYLHDAIGGSGANRGRAYLYLGSASGIVQSPVWTGNGEESGAWYGWSVSTAGDVNGDGYSDVVIGSYLYNAGGTDRGRAYVYLGSSSGNLTLSPGWPISGTADNDYVGSSVSTAGDVNGDGYADVIVGAKGVNSSGANRGRVYLFPGGPGGASSSSLWNAAGDEGDDDFGFAVSTAGDVDGDGYADVIVGAPRHNGGGGSGADRGRAFVYLGGPSWPSATPAWTASGGENGARFGSSVATAGDVNGDGRADVLVGAWHDGAGGSQRGEAYLYLGSASGPATTAELVDAGDEDNAYFGYSVATAGDVNGDGFSDVIAGAYGHNAGGGSGADKGRAYVYFGSRNLPVLTSWSVFGEGLRSEFGAAVASAGDVNGDGFGDVLVGAPELGRKGRAYLFQGSSSGLSAVPAWWAEEASTDADFGASVASAGDVNGDGFGDVVVGAPHYGYYIGGFTAYGGAWLYLGSPTGLAMPASAVATLRNPGDGDDFGASVASAGDVNGDGYSDLIVGAPGEHVSGVVAAGEAFVYLGAACGVVTAPSWMATGPETNSDFGRSVASAGDVNRDGFSDVVVGAPKTNSPGTWSGSAFVYMGSASGLGSAAAWTNVSPGTGARFGSSVASAGDVNGDGFSDVLVGAPAYGGQDGRVHLYFGAAGGLSPSAGWISAGAALQELGRSVAPAGDVNGDGFADVLVGGALKVGSAGGTGLAALYLGSPTGPASPATADWPAEGPQEPGKEVSGFGTAVAGAGDVDGDGFSDVLVGAPNQYDTGRSNYYGSAFFYFGNGGAGEPVGPKQRRSSGTAPVAELGAVTDGQFRIVWTARSPFGRSDVKPEWQLARLGSSFPTPASSGGFVDGGVSGVAVDELLPLPSPDGPWRWRIRAKYGLPTSPFLGHGPWTTPADDGATDADLRRITCPTSVTMPPSTVTVYCHQSATLTVTASGSANRYLWFEGTTGNTSTPVGTNSPSFTTPPLATPKSYWVRVTCGGSTTDGPTVTVTVSPPPLPVQITKITKNPSTGRPILHIRDQNPSGAATGLRIRVGRNFTSSIPQWPSAAYDLGDADPATPDIQWTDLFTDTSSTIWYFEVNAVSSTCGTEGPY